MSTTTIQLAARAMDLCCHAWRSKRGDRPESRDDFPTLAAVLAQASRESDAAAVQPVLSADEWPLVYRTLEGLYATARALPARPVNGIAPVSVRDWMREHVPAACAAAKGVVSAVLLSTVQTGGGSDADEQLLSTSERASIVATLRAAESRFVDAVRTAASESIRQSLSTLSSHDGATAAEPRARGRAVGARDAIARAAWVAGRSAARRQEHPLVRSRGAPAPARRAAPGATPSLPPLPRSPMAAQRAPASRAARLPRAEHTARPTPRLPRPDPQLGLFDISPARLALAPAAFGRAQDSAPSVLRGSGGGVGAGSPGGSAALACEPTRSRGPLRLRNAGGAAGGAAVEASAATAAAAGGRQQPQPQQLQQRSQHLDGATSLSTDGQPSERSDELSMGEAEANTGDDGASAAPLVAAARLEAFATSTLAAEPAEPAAPDSPSDNVQPLLYFAELAAISSLAGSDSAAARAQLSALQERVRLEEELADAELRAAAADADAADAEADATDAEAEAARTEAEARDAEAEAAAHADAAGRLARAATTATEVAAAEAQIERAEELSHAQLCAHNRSLSARSAATHARTEARRSREMASHTAACAHALAALASAPTSLQQAASDAGGSELAVDAPAGPGAHPSASAHAVPSLLAQARAVYAQLNSALLDAADTRTPATEKAALAQQHDVAARARVRLQLRASEAAQQLTAARAAAAEPSAAHAAGARRFEPRGPARARVRTAPPPALLPPGRPGHRVTVGGSARSPERDECGLRGDGGGGRIARVAHDVQAAQRRARAVRLRRLVAEQTAPAQVLARSSSAGAAAARRSSNPCGSLAEGDGCSARLLRESPMRVLSQPQILAGQASLYLGMPTVDLRAERRRAKHARMLAALRGIGSWGGGAGCADPAQRDHAQAKSAAQQQQHGMPTLRGGVVGATGRDHVHDLARLNALMADVGRLAGAAAERGLRPKPSSFGGTSARL